MKAVMFWNVNKPLSVENLPDPTPGEGEVVIKVGRCGICGSDVSLTKEPGYYPENSVLGHEYAGEIVAVGPKVEGFKIGDNIAAMPTAGCAQCAGCRTAGPFFCDNGVLDNNTGGFAEYLAVKTRAAIKLPSTLSLADGALVEPLAVSFHGVKLAATPPGARVLVLGAGSVGLTAIYWARKLGAGRIVAMARSAWRADMALKMGADAYLQTGEGEAERIAEVLGGPPDVVYECVGAVGALGHSIELVRPLGTVISLGFCTQPDPITSSFTTFKQIKLIFSMAYTLGEFQSAAESLDRGHIEPRLMVSSVVPLNAMPATIERLRAGNTDTKIHCDPWLAT